MEHHSPTLTFDEFFNMYPNAINYGAGLKAWNDLNPPPLIQKAIRDALEWQCRDWTKTERRYIPSPASYLLRQRWKDKPMGWFKRVINKPVQHKDTEQDRNALLETLYADVEARPDVYRKGYAVLGALGKKVLSERVLRAIDAEALPNDFNPPILQECPW